MSKSGRLTADPLFQGLARPTMIAGVSYMYFVLNALISLIAFINSHNLLVLFIVMPSIHAVGYLICMKEPRAIELLMLRGKNGYLSINNIVGFHFHANSYDLF